MLCFHDFVTTFVGRSTSDSWELYAGASNSVSTDYLGNPLTRMEDLLTDRPYPSCHPSFYFGFGFSGIPAPVSWWLVRHFAQILNLRMSSMNLCFQMLCLLLVSTIPVVAMKETNCFQN